jgi:cell division protein FtsZ
VRAAQQAIYSPLLEDIDIEGASGILINITAGSQVSLMEISQACAIVQEAAHEDANIIFGTVIDENLTDEIRVTVIATGFPADGAANYHVKATSSQRTVSGASARPSVVAPVVSAPVAAAPLAQPVAPVVQAAPQPVAPVVHAAPVAQAPAPQVVVPVVAAPITPVMAHPSIFQPTAAPLPMAAAGMDHGELDQKLDAALAMTNDVTSNKSPDDDLDIPAFMRETPTM